MAREKKLIAVLLEFDVFHNKNCELVNEKMPIDLIVDKLLDKMDSFGRSHLETDLYTLKRRRYMSSEV